MGNESSKDGKEHATNTSGIVVLPCENEKHWGQLEKILTGVKTVEQFCSAMENIFTLKQCTAKPATLTEFIGTMSDEQKAQFQEAIETVIELVFQMPVLFQDHCTKTNQIKLLTQVVPRSLTLTKKQVACLVSAQFLCLIEQQSYHDQHFPDPTFSDLLLYPHPQNLAKMQMFVNYFTQIRQNPSCLEGELTIHRVVLSTPPAWKTSEKLLLPMTVKSTEKIEDQPNHLHADFANKFIGGGVLQHVSLSRLLHLYSK
jgi:Asp-tRNA(Asn)/Glu-tRNA(Gln) amidotransferase C subunit